MRAIQPEYIRCVVAVRCNVRNQEKTPIEQKNHFQTFSCQRTNQKKKKGEEEKTVIKIL